MQTNFFIKTLKEQESLQSTVLFINEERKTKLIYECQELHLSSEDEFPFFALIKIRLQLEDMGLLLMCNGSRKDVYPSGMSASSIMAYEMKLKKPATILVNIFEQINEVEMLSTVAEQKSYRELWLASLKS